MTAPRYWLVKSEPLSYGIDHLRKDRKTAWTGVRNYQARNYLRDSMQVGDPVLFYHSNCPVPGIYGLARVASASYPDPTQFDPKSQYYEPRATKEKPVWYVVDVAFVEKFREPITLTQIKADPKLHGMQILKPGNRLSVTEVLREDFKILSDF